jgi:hypothetical protein
MGQGHERQRWERKAARSQQVCDSKSMTFTAGAGYDHWQGGLERTFAPKDVFAAQDLVSGKLVTRT